MVSFIPPLSTFYLPNLSSSRPKTFPLAVILNKCDLPRQIKKSQVSKIVKPLFNNATISSSGRMNGRVNGRFSLNTTFREVMDQLRQGDK